MAKIKNVFVLMLENRSFDHMLGYSGIRGYDAETGKETGINAVKGHEDKCTNKYKGTTYKPQAGAKFSMPFDPNHEFMDVVEQLTGKREFKKGQDYPDVDNSGFIENYDRIAKGFDLDDVMRGYTPEQLPVMNALAKEFAVCDGWFSSMPGPTWPNRFFAMAATAKGWDHSPGKKEMGTWESVSGLSFEHGNIFSVSDNQTKAGSRIYMDRSMGDTIGTTPISTALENVSKVTDVWNLTGFHGDLQKDVYPYSLTFIEPSYGDVAFGDYANGSSQHPNSDVRLGEALIKSVYESIRNSKHWENSLLIITYDEHGGFYDHVKPPKARRPDDIKGTKYGFKFDRYGTRVPALIISPYIRKNTIDKRLYDHSSISKTLSKIFDTMYLTERDQHANSLTKLLTLDNPRTDTPTRLPNPASDAHDLKGAARPRGLKAINENDALPESGNLMGFLSLVSKEELGVSPKEEHEVIKDNFNKLHTRKDAFDYVNKVTEMVKQYEANNVR